MAAKRKFSDDELVAAYVECEGNKTHIAKALGVSTLTVRKRINQLPSGMLIEKDQWNDVHKLESMRDLQRRMLTSITDAEIKAASLKMRITAVAILEDKIRTMEGKAVEHVEHKMLHSLDPKYLEALKELDDRMTKAKLENINYDDGDVVDAEPVEVLRLTGSDTAGDSAEDREAGSEDASVGRHGEGTT
jgi:transposase-like protein